MTNNDPMQKNGLGESLPSRNDAKGEHAGITRENGAPVINNQDTMTAGQRGPQILQDAWLLEKHAHFNREVIPERRMHAKGSGAFGEFMVTQDITKYSKAKIFSDIGKKPSYSCAFLP
jgi:catalase